jgi:hypothetical protein
VLPWKVCNNPFQWPTSCAVVPPRLYAFRLPPGIVWLSTLHPSRVYALGGVVGVTPAVGSEQKPSNVEPAGTPGVPAADCSSDW